MDAVTKKLDLDDAEKNSDEKEADGDDQEKPLAFQFLSLLKNQIRLDKEVEIYKESLFSYEAFNTIDAFKLFD